MIDDDDDDDDDDTARRTRGSVLNGMATRRPIRCMKNTKTEQSSPWSKLSVNCFQEQK